GPCLFREVPGRGGTDLDRTGEGPQPRAAVGANALRRLLRRHRPRWRPSRAASSLQERALRGRRRGRLGCRRTVAALGHELVDLGAVLGGAQLVEILAELALLLVEPAQRLLAILVEGDVARCGGTAAPAMPTLPFAPFLATSAPFIARGVTLFGCIPA